MFQALRFVAGRVFVAVLTMVGVSLVVFGAMRAIPGSYANVVLGPRATQQAVDNLNNELGLNDSLFIQFGRWAGDLLRGDLGTSLRSGEPILSEFVDRAGVTVELALIACVLSLTIGIPAGVLGAVVSKRRGQSAVAETTNSLFLSLPDILIGGIIVFFISRYAVPFTIGVWPSIVSDPLGNLAAALPAAAAISSLGIGFVMLATRGAVAETLDEPYVLAALARGATAVQVMRRHVARNSVVPVLTVFTVYLGYLLGGAVISEVIFSLNGVGRYIIDAAQQRDYPAVQGGILVAAGAFILLNMLVDILYGIIDPRIAAGRHK